MPIWAQIVVPVMTAVLTLIATTVTNYFLNGPKRRREQHEKEMQNLSEEIETLRKDINDTLQQQRAYSKQMAEDIKLLKAGNQAMLKEELKTQYQHWIELKYAPMDVKEDLERLYQVYHSLGANGIMDHLRKSFMDLPTDEP